MDFSRDMIIYRVDIGAFFGVGRKVGFWGKPEHIFP